MKLLYSEILPLGTTEDQKTIVECIVRELEKADRIDIAVGYVSNASLIELNRLIFENHISNVCLNIGMYFVEGMPESSYHTALRINEKWHNAGIGEVRIVKAFKYHGKVYCFYKEGVPFSAVIGSANLGVLKLEASNRRQYEIAAITENAEEAAEIAKHLENLKEERCSQEISQIRDIPLVHEVNTSLIGVELVTQVPKSNVDFYKSRDSEVLFSLLLKVPCENEKHIDDGKHYTKSNINVCYAAPRNKRKPRDWYETQLTVGADVYRMEGYPEKNKSFFVVTDDGYWFKAHTTSDNNKQFSAVGDELIMGRWLKGRLAAAGLVRPVNNTQLDIDRTGMITKEILDEYGCDRLKFKKTGQTALDEEGTPLNVWLLSFAAEND